MPVAPDLDVSRPTAEEVAAAAALASALDRLGRGVEEGSTHFGSVATGEALEGARGDMAGTRDTADSGASSAVAAAQTMRDMRNGGDVWLRNAPKQADLERATQKVASIRAEMQLAALSGLPASLLQERLEAAKAELRELESRRKAADEAYEQACRRGAGRLIPQEKCQPRGRSTDIETSGGGGYQTPRTEANKLDTPPAAAPSTPGAPAPAPGTPAPSAPPATRPSSAPPATAPSTSCSSSPGLNADALKLLASQAQNPQQPQMAAPSQQPAPQLAAQSGAPTAAGPAQNAKTSGALTADDFGDTIAPAPVGLGLASGGSPAATVSPSAPAPAAAAAAPVSQTPGTSANNLSTVADTSGRPEPARTAYNPTTTTSHATGSAAAPATPLAGRGMGVGAGMPHMPMVPMGGMPGGGAGGGGSRGGDGSKVTAYDSGRDHGASSINEAVRGGTIAQRRELD